jgi:hypothetical protein
LVADLQGVAEAPGRHEKGALASALEQGVGGDGGAHLDDADRPSGDRRARGEAEEVADRLHRGVIVGRILGEELSRMQAAPRVAADDVGEGAAAIDPEIPKLGRGFFPSRNSAGHLKLRKFRSARRLGLTSTTSYR